MSAKSIMVWKDNLEENTSSLISLKDDCANIKSFNACPFIKSKGRFRDKSNDLVIIADEIKKDLSILVDNSYKFYEKAGIKINEADSQAAKNICENAISADTSAKTALLKDTTNANNKKKNEKKQASNVCNENSNKKKRTTRAHSY